MNILIDIRPTQNAHKKSGIGRYAFNLTRLLPVIDADNRYFFGYYNKFEIPEYPCEISGKVKFIPLKNRKPRFWETNEWEKIIKEFDIDVLHFLDIETPLRLPAGVKIVCTVHDIIPKIHPNFVYYKMDLLRRVKKRVSYYLFLNNLKYVDRIIAVSKCTRDDIKRVCGVRDEKISVVYEGVDYERFYRSMENKRGILEKYRIRKPYLLHVGGFDLRKNIETLLESYKVSGLFDYQLVIAGESKKDMPRIIKYIDYLGLRKYVCLPGFIDDEDLPVIYRNAEAFFYLSLYEGFGLPILEAMASETLVVTSNISSIPEISEGVAILVNPRDVYEIASVIKKIKEGELDRKMIVEKGKERARMFSWENTARVTAEVYSRVIA